VWSFCQSGYSKKTIQEGTRFGTFNSGGRDVSKATESKSILCLTCSGFYTKKTLLHGQEGLLTTSPSSGTSKSLHQYRFVPVNCMFQMLWGANVFVLAITSNVSSFCVTMDVLDKQCLMAQSRAAHFVNMLSDALHCVSGIAPAQLTILDVRKLERHGFSDVGGLGQNRRYTVVFEVRLYDVPDGNELHSAVKGIWSLHQLHTLNRWKHLPFFRHNAIEAPEMDVSENNPHVRELCGHLEQQSIMKIKAHVDLIDASSTRPYLQSGRSFREMAADFEEAVATILGISPDQHGPISIICIHLRPCHVPRSTESCFKEVCDTLFREERVAGRAEPESGLDDVDDSVQGSSQNQECMPAASAHVLGTPLGYTIEFEVTSNLATRWDSQEQFLTAMQAKLRKMHSISTFNAHQNMNFFKSFRFDCGMHVDEAPGWKACAPCEQHLFPNSQPMGATVSPVLLGGQMRKKTGLFCSVDTSISSRDRAALQTMHP